MIKTVQKIYGTAIGVHHPVIDGVRFKEEFNLLIGKMRTFVYKPGNQNLCERNCLIQFWNETRDQNPKAFENAIKLVDL